MGEAPDTVFVTCGALQFGIIEGRIIEEHANGSATICCSGVYAGSPIFRPGDWHWSRKIAAYRARQMREAKIKGLEAELKQVKALRFEGDN